MSSKKRNTTNIFNCICFLLAALSALGVLFSFLGFRKSIRDFQFDQFKIGLNETAEHNLIDVNNLLNAMVGHLETTGETINKYDDFSHPDIKGILNFAQQTSMFDFISLANSDGIGYDNNGNTFNVAEREYFQTAMNGHVAFSDVMESQVIPGDSVQIIAHPIRTADKTVRGVIFGVFNVRDLASFASHFVHEDDASIYIVDSCGAYIARFHRSDFLPSSGNFWSDLELSSVDAEKIATLKNNFDSRSEGGFSYDYHGDRHYACHMPIGPNKWQLVYSVSSTPMNQIILSLQRLDLRYALLAGACHVILTLCIIWYFIRANRKIRIAHLATKRNVESVRIAIEHSQHIVFEYDQETGTIRLKTDLRNPLFDRSVISSAPESLIERNIIAPDSISNFRALFEDIKTQLSCETEIQLISDSKELWCRISLNNVYDEDNKITATVGIAEDISDQKEKEVEMERRLQVQETLIANAISYSKIDLDNDIVTEFNGEKTHLPFQSLLTQQINELVLPDHIPYVAQALSLDTLREAYRQEKESIEVEFIMDCAGTPKWVSCVIYGLYSDDHAGAISVITDIDDRKRLEIALKEQAERDGLTGLYNSATIRSKINEILAQQHTLHGQQIFILIDLDNYKLINDTFGHSFGDQVLIEVSEILDARFRSDDLVGRLGGDEFLIFLRNVNSLDGVSAAIEGLCQSIRKTYRDGDKEVTISASIGIASSPDDGTTFEELYKKSDSALYQIKNAGKNGFRHFRQS